VVAGLDYFQRKAEEAARGGGTQVSFGHKMLRSICCGSNEEKRLGRCARERERR
jgi:hypothetical protein